MAAWHLRCCKAGRIFRLLWLVWAESSQWAELVHVTEWNCEAPRCRKTTPRRGRQCTTALQTAAVSTLDLSTFDEGF